MNPWKLSPTEAQMIYGPWTGGWLPLLYSTKKKVKYSLWEKLNANNDTSNLSPLHSTYTFPCPASIMFTLIFSLGRIHSNVRLLLSYRWHAIWRRPWRSRGQLLVLLGLLTASSGWTLPLHSSLSITTLRQNITGKNSHYTHLYFIWTLLSYLLTFFTLKYLNPLIWMSLYLYWHNVCDCINLGYMCTVQFCLIRPFKQMIIVTQCTTFPVNH